MPRPFEEDQQGRQGDRHGLRQQAHTVADQRADAVHDPAMDQAQLMKVERRQREDRGQRLRSAADIVDGLGAYGVHREDHSPEQSGQRSESEAQQNAPQQQARGRVQQDIYQVIGVGIEAAPGVVRRDRDEKQGPEHGVILLSGEGLGRGEKLRNIRQAPDVRILLNRMQIVIVEGIPGGIRIDQNGRQHNGEGVTETAPR
jgi:hypothetical protein